MAADFCCEIIEIVEKNTFGVITQIRFEGIPARTLYLDVALAHVLEKLAQRHGVQRSFENALCLSEIHCPAALFCEKVEVSGAAIQ